MKKRIAILLALVALVSGCLLRSSSVQAACGAYWEVGERGETVGACDGEHKSEDGTFIAKTELDNGENGKYALNITLDNYNSGKFKFETYLGGITVTKVTITLVGENVVPQEVIMSESYGRSTSIEIKGDGKLTISDVVATDESSKEEDEEEEGDGVSMPLLIVNIAVGVYVVISVVVFVILGLKIKNLKTKK